MNPNEKNKIVSKSEWTKARQQFLVKEKAFTHQRDELSAERQKLPWLKIDKEYVFNSEEGNVSLSDMFKDRSQLIIYHFMFAPEWTQGCPGCSFMADHYNPAVVHLNHHDVSLVTVSRAPINKISAFKRRMGWNFEWVSSFDNDFNRDFRVSFTAKENASGLKLYNQETEEGKLSDLPGMSVFFRDENGNIYLTYSTFARGLDMFLTTNHLLDIAPKGRNEESGMDWVKHHDRYDQGEYIVHPWEEVPGNSVRG